MGVQSHTIEVTKLWKLFSSLLKDEREQFLRWLKYELDGKAQYIQLLAGLLAEMEAAPLRSEVWAHLYPDQAYDDARLRKLFRDLLRNLEEYLSIASFRKKDSLKSLLLLEDLKDRDRPEVFQSTFRKVYSELDQRSVLPVEDSLIKYRMVRVLQEFSGRELPQSTFDSGTQDASGPLALQGRLLDEWLTQELIAFKLYALSFEQQGYGDLQSTLARYFLQSPELVPLLPESSPLAHAFFEVMDMLQSKIFLEGEKGLELMKEIRRSAPSEQAKVFFLLLLNHHAQLMNKTLSPETQSFIEGLYDWGLEDGLLLEDQYLSPRHYRNLVSILLINKQPEKAFRYVEQLKQQIAPEEREPEYLLAKARCMFAMGHYREVITILAPIQFSDEFTEIQARLMLIQSYFERSTIDDYDWLSGQVKQFIRYLRNFRQQGNTLIQLAQLGMRLLDRLLLSNSAKCPPSLKKQLEDMPASQLRNWLYAKYQERFPDL